MLTLFIAEESFLSEITKRISQAINPILLENQCELVDVDYVTEKDQAYLRVYVDQVGGIDLEKIAALSELISKKLDVLDPDPLPNPYTLEVSSPGLERPIKTESELKKAVGKYLHVSLYQKLSGQKSFEGTLKHLDENELTLAVKQKTRVKEVAIPRRLVANLRFAVEF